MNNVKCVADAVIECSPNEVLRIIDIQFFQGTMSERQAENYLNYIERLKEAANEEHGETGITLLIYEIDGTSQLEGCIVFSNSYITPERYQYPVPLFPVSWNEAFGYRISKANMEKYGVAAIVAVIIGVITMNCDFSEFPLPNDQRIKNDSALSAVTLFLNERDSATQE